MLKTLNRRPPKLPGQCFHLSLALTLLASLFFVGGPDPYALPGFSYAWNLGHIAFFILLGIALHNLNANFIRQRALSIFILVFGVSIAIECMQSIIGRSFSLMDIFRNLTGIGLTLTLLYRTRHLLLLAIPLSAFLVFDLSGFVKTLHSDYLLQGRAPIIEDFQHRSTLRQWLGEIELTKDSDNDQNQLAHLTFPPGKYSGIYVDSILKDWRSYKQLNMRLFNPYQTQQELALRLNDVAHERTSQEYSDRFNTVIELNPGWNLISIPLSEIKAAPEQREMDLSRMYRLMLFYGFLEEPRELLLDDISLN